MAVSFDAETVARLDVLRRASRGDADALISLASDARALVLAEQVDEYITSLEGVTYSRLAAAQGRADALVLLIEHSAHLGKLAADAEDWDASDDWHGQVIALLEIVADRLPMVNADCLTVTLNQAASESSPSVMEAAKVYRNFWAPVFGAEAFA